MAEALREVSEECPGGRVNLLREQAERICALAESRIQVERFVGSSLHR
jgi:hypothetical protein